MSRVEVDKIQQQCGSTLTVGGGASKTVTVDATTVTLGRCGGTVSLASGATQSGFGRTGTVDWQTSSIKTATFTAVSGEGYFANTSGGAFTMNLPAGTAGNIVSVVDYTNTFQTNNLTIAPNGSEKIGGVAAQLALSTEGQSVTFVYVDDTEGWKNTMDSTSNATGNAFIIASGGTVTTCGNDKIHTFTGPGTFTVSKASCTAAENVVSYMIVGGGGGGGSGCGTSNGGGGAGGFREVKSPTTPYTASPLDGYPSAPNRVTVTAQAYPIVVGAGGLGTLQPGPGARVATQGGDSSFGGITGAGGGKGSSHTTTCASAYGYSGGSGSGGGPGPFTGTGTYYNGPGCAGAGNTPPTTPSQGNPGGTGYTTYNSPPGNSNIGGGGGGGATAAGADMGPGLPTVAPGGAGATTSISGSPTAYAGGGGGGNLRQGPLGPTPAGQGGAGGGGNGGTCGDASGPAATAGGTNTGGGGGGSGNAPGAPGTIGGANGGSGIVIIRYKYQ